MHRFGMEALIKLVPNDTELLRVVERVQAMEKENEKLKALLQRQVQREALVLQQEAALQQREAQLLALEQQATQLVVAASALPQSTALPRSINAKDAAHSIASAVRAARAAPAPPPASDGSSKWSAAEWLGARVAPPVSKALLRPLGGDAPPHVALTFLKELGSAGTPAFRGLFDERLLDDLATTVGAALAELA